MTKNANDGWYLTTRYSSYWIFVLQLQKFCNVKNKVVLLVPRHVKKDNTVRRRVCCSCTKLSYERYSRCGAHTFFETRNTRVYE